MVLDVVAWAATHIDIVKRLEDEVRITVYNEAFLDRECIGAALGVSCFCCMCVLDTATYVHLYS